MYILLREAIVKSLKRSGYRVISPLKVPLGWVDIAIRGLSMGVDIFDGSFESCAERLSSYPFNQVLIIGNCDSCQSLKKFCKKLQIDEPNVESPRKAIVDDDIKTKALIDSLVYLYIAREVYQDSIEFKPLRAFLQELKYYDLVSSSSRHTFRPKFFISLTRDGYRVAKKAIVGRLALFERKLRKLASPLTYTIALGISHRLKLEKFSSPENYSNQALLKYMFSIDIDDMKTESLNPKAMVCEFLTKFILNREAINLAEKLCRMGLAVKLTVYSPYGDKIGEEYRFARETLESLMKFSYAEIPKNLISEFLSVFYPLKNKDVSQILRYCQKDILTAEKYGVCKLDGTKITLYNNFVNFARVKLADVSGKIIENLSLQS